jgi:flagellar P-ring protein precursor FlgI
MMRQHRKFTAIARSPIPDPRSLGQGRFLVVSLLSLLLATPALAVRIKDVATWEGVRDNQLIGYGLVVGLNDTGDTSTDFTAQSVAAYLRRNGVNVDPDQLKTGNVAAVVVTSTLPPFDRPGQAIDVVVSSIGDADSLFGGTLLQTPLAGADGLIYAVAQGPIAIGGFEAQSGGTSVSRNHLTVARLAGGALIERPSPVTLEGRTSLNLLLNNPDFTTAQRLANAINHSLGGDNAAAKDATCVEVALPPGAPEDIVNFVSQVERLEVSPDTRARIVVNERTGTIVMTEDVRISTFAITHGNLNIQTTRLNGVSQPAPFSQGVTAEVNQNAVSVQEESRRVAVVPEGVSLSELVQALNALGVTPRDLIAILQAIRAAGALQADLEII